MGYLGLSVLTDVKHFWYLHNDVNYCSVRALAKCPVSCEISHCWHCLCSPINCSNLRLDAITAVEELTCFEEILTYEVQEGTKMPQACGCPGCATDSSDSSSFCTSDTAVNDHEPLIYGDKGRGKATCRVADLWFCNVTNQLIVVVFLFVFFLLICVQLTREHQVALSSITYIGCALSIFCLTITLVTFAVLSWVILT